MNDTGKQYETACRFYLRYTKEQFSRHTAIRDKKRAEKEFNEIVYSELNAEDVDTRFAEFLEIGNRPRHKKLFGVKP
ncbi:MAG: hypothetical protein J6A92_02795 [Lachnospiraceae bacterium]|nr:hypothetical protein [Lachnospiraceae bacterium]